MFDRLMIVLILAVLVLFVCTAGMVYSRSEKKREERRLMEQKKDIAGNPDAGLTRMAMHTGYNGLNTRGRIN